MVQPNVSLFFSFFLFLSHGSLEIPCVSKCLILKSSSRHAFHQIFPSYSVSCTVNNGELFPTPFFIYIRTAALFHTSILVLHSARSLCSSDCETINSLSSCVSSSSSFLLMPLPLAISLYLSLSPPPPPVRAVAEARTLALIKFISSP